MKKTVFTFGRMNPPTVGHEKLVAKVNEVAKRQKATPLVYLSHTQNKKKDPLSYDQKIKFATKSFGKIVVKSRSKTIIQILQELESKKYTDITMVVGSDRVEDFKGLLNKYNGKDYTFNSIEIVSAGARDPDAEGVEGMSASKMRSLVADGEMEEFHTGAPSKLSYKDAHSMYNDLRKGMMLEDLDFKLDIDAFVEQFNVDSYDLEDLDEAAPMTMSQRLKRARQMKRMAPRFKNLRKIKAKRMADPARLIQRAQKQAKNIIRKRMAGEKGAKYNTLSVAAKIAIDKLTLTKAPAIKMLAKRLLPKVRQAEMQRLKQARSSKKESYDILSFNGLNEDVTQKQINDLEKFADRLLAKFDIDVEFTRHFADRMNDSRNSPEIKVSELQRFFKKIAKNKGKNIRQNADAEVVLKDMQADLNLPVVIKYDKDKQDFEVINKTIMRKKDFKTTSKTIQYEGTQQALNDSFEMFLESKFSNAEKVQDKGERDRLRAKHAAERKRQKETHDDDMDQARSRDTRTVNRSTRVESLDLLDEGVNDPGIFKAVFLAGGPGSGKSFVVGKTALTALGLKLINSDTAFEKYLTKADLTFDPDDIMSDEGQAARAKAKAVTGLKLKGAINGRLGLVIDGTGKDFAKIIRQAMQLKILGYEVAMIFVNTDLETALARNANRSRTLPDDKVTEMWKDVQKNIGKFQNYFSDKFVVVDNSNDANIEGAVKSAYNKMSKWIKLPPKTPKSKMWIKSAKQARGITEQVEQIDELFEKFTGNDKFGINRFASKTLKKKSYNHAAQTLKDLISRKKKEKTERHGVLYYAAKVAKSYAGVDARTLANMVEGYTKTEEALIKKALKHHIPLEVVEEVYDRGMVAYGGETDIDQTQEQYAFSRLNSFIGGGKATTIDYDIDLQPYVEVDEEKFQPHMMYDPKTGEGKKAYVKKDHLAMKAKGWGHDKPKVKEDEAGGAGEFGTDKLKKKYEKDTPGEKK